MSRKNRRTASLSTTTKLAVASIIANKSRSILIIISILLTTMLLTILALTGYGLIQNERLNAGVRYGEHYGAYTGVSEELYKKIKAHAEFYDVGKMETFATVDFEDADGYLSFRDKTAMNISHSETEEGNFPEKENEITGQKSFFRAAGNENPKIGDIVLLTYRVGDRKYETAEFVICGFLKEYEANDLKKTYAAFVSEDFYDAAVPKEERSYSVVFKVQNDENLTENGMEEKIKELASELGLEENQVIINHSYLMWQLDPGTETIAVCLAISLMVVLFAVLVIYNIFYVGMIQRVQEYGKLRAVGATRKQMKHMVLKEGMLLAVPGVAVGVLLGWLVSSIFFHGLLQRIYAEIDSVEIEKIQVGNLPLMLLAAAVAFLTVFLSMRKPMKIVSHISPVDAMRYQEEDGKKKAERSGYFSLNVWRLTLANLSRNKKRTLTTIFTMGLSCVLFVVAANVAGNMDAEYDARKYVEMGDFYISLDFSLNDKAYPERNLNHVQELNLMSEEWLDEIRQIDGVTEIETRNAVLVRRKNIAESDDVPYMWAAVYSREDYEKLEAKRGSIDYDSAVKQQGIVFASDYWMEDYGYAIGDAVELTFLDGEREVPMTFTLTGSAEERTYFILTEEQFESMHFTENMTTDVWISCEKDMLAEAEVELNRMISQSEYYEMTTYQDAYKLSSMAVNLMKGALYALLGILGVIGFMNMANTLITGIITRKRELGILQAIGMTGRQLNCMLQMEGMVFTIGTLLVSFTFGNLFGYAAFLKCKAISMIGIHIYHIPVAELLVMAAALLLMQSVLSLYLSRHLQRESLVERIRHQE